MEFLSADIAPQFVEVSKKHYEDVASYVADELAALDRAITPVQCETRVTKRFEGDEWNLVLENKPLELTRVFVEEAAIACGVHEDAIRNVQFRLGSLYVTFHVNHDEEVSHDEIDRRVGEYPFREVWRLYQQRQQPASGLDAALEQIRELEESGAAKDAEIERLEKELGEKTNELAKLRDASAEAAEQLKQMADQREQELLNALANAQEELQAAKDMIATLEKQKQMALTAVERGKKKLQEQMERNADIIAAIMQENKEEMKAKEREYSEVVDKLRAHNDKLRQALLAYDETDLYDGMDDPVSARRISTARTQSVEPDRKEEFSQLLSQMEQLTVVLESSREAEANARSEIARLTEALKISEEARHAESVMYENDKLALEQQLTAYREVSVSESHQARVEAKASNGSNSNSARISQDNDLIQKQYDKALRRVVDTLVDRLGIVDKEFNSYLTSSEDESEKEKNLLLDQDQETHRIRTTFRTASTTLQKIFWTSRDKEVVQLCEDLDNAASDMEKSRAVLTVTASMLESRKGTIKDQKAWMASHLKSLNEMITSVSELNTRVIARKLDMVSNGRGAQ